MCTVSPHSELDLYYIFLLHPLFIECCERPKAFKTQKDLFGIVQNYLYAVVLWDRMGSYALCSLFRIVSNSVMACTGLWSFQGKKLSSSGRWKRCLVKLRRLCYTIRRGSWSAVLGMGKTWYVGLVSWKVQEEAITRESTGDSGWGAGWLSTLCPLPLSNGTWDANMQNYKSPTILRAQYVVQVRTWLLTKRVEGRIQPAEMFFQLMV